MPILRPFATFHAGLPDDSEENSSGDIVVPAGRNLVERLAGTLRADNLTVKAPHQHSFYGWVFDVQSGNATVWCLVQYPEPWLLVTELRGDTSARTTGQDFHATVLNAIDRALKADSLVSKVQWFTKAEYESGARAGQHSPVAG
jgi:hypothetical protein